MNGIKYSFTALAMLLLGACHASNKTEENENIMADAAELQGVWLLESYRVDDKMQRIEGRSKYKLTFNNQDNTFSLSTDCNMINGEFGITNDTIRFRNMLVTEMACDNMVVEQCMLRLLNSLETYSLYNNDTLTLTAPNVGKAIFIKHNDKPNFIGKTYSGGGNGGGLAIDLTIKFMTDSTCECTSDFYQAFREPVKVSGKYFVTKDIVKVTCRPDGFEDHSIEWHFNITENGNKLSYNNLDANEEGSIGKDWITLYKK